jgi:sugar phosphate permease
VVLVTGVVSSLFQLMIGVLVDRFGPRYVLGAGVACLGVTVWLLTVATTIWQFGLAYGVLGGFSLAATRQVVAATLVGNWFILRRGLVQGMVGSAGALGEMLVVPLNMFLERDYGWQHMYRSMGTVLLVGVLPFIWAFVRNRPEDIGLHPHGTTLPRQAATTGESRPVEGIPFRAALGQPQTWVLIYLGFASPHACDLCRAWGGLCRPHGLGAMAHAVRLVLVYGHHIYGAVVEFHHFTRLDHLYRSLRSAVPGLGLEPRL